MDKDVEYERELLKKIEDIRIGLYYYIKRCQALQCENDYLKSAYEHRVNEYLKENSNGK